MNKNINLKMDQQRVQIFGKLFLIYLIKFLKKHKKIIRMIKKKKNYKMIMRMMKLKKEENKICLKFILIKQNKKNNIKKGVN